MSDRIDQRFESAMGRMLQIGVTTAAIVVLIGAVLYLRHAAGPMPSYHQFHGAPAAYESVHGILDGLVNFNGQGLIAFGILLLIATPICRVVFGVVGFSLLRDRFYTAVSLTVLMILILSLALRR